MYIRGKFTLKILVMCKSALLRTLLVLRTELGVGMSWGSRYVQWRSFNYSINRLAADSNCTIVEQRVVIRFLWWWGGGTCYIHKIMLAQYGENCSLQRKGVPLGGRVSKWQNDEDRSDRSITSRTADIVEWLKRTDGLLSVTWMTGWTSAVGLHIPSSTRTSGIAEFV
jgi:hypothetical protein